MIFSQENNKRVSKVLIRDQRKKKENSIRMEYEGFRNKNKEDFEHWYHSILNNQKGDDAPIKASFSLKMGKVDLEER